MGLDLGVLLADARMLEVALDLLSVQPGDAQLFLMDDAVEMAHDERVHALLERGVDVSLCATDAEARGVKERDGGPRFASQYEHACLVRDAKEIVAMTGAGIDAQAPKGCEKRTVSVRVTRGPEHPKTSQALRTAVGYAACDLNVIVRIDPPAASLLEMPSRALATLKAMGHRVTKSSEALPGDVEVTW